MGMHTNIVMKGNGSTVSKCSFCRAAVLFFSESYSQSSSLVREQVRIITSYETQFGSSAVWHRSMKYETCLTESTGTNRHPCLQ